MGDGATVGAMALLAGVSRYTWTRAERGDHISDAVWRRIAHTLGRPESEIRP